MTEQYQSRNNVDMVEEEDQVGANEHNPCADHALQVACVQNQHASKILSEIEARAPEVEM